MRIRDEFVLRTIAGQTFVVALGSASRELNGMLRLNETAKVIWEGLAQGMTQSEIVRSLTAQYDVTPEQAETDCENLIDQLRRLHILE